MNAFPFKNKIVLLALVSVFMILLAAGCSKKPAVETLPETVVDTTPAETLPPPSTQVTPEVPDRSVPDYPSLQPSEYGVEDVFFDFDKYDLSDQAMATLAKDARIMREANVLTLISGHCDERGTVEYNLALGEKRAKAVRDYLITLGVPAQKMLITSYGKSKPFAEGHNERAWAQNRRAHFEKP